MKNIAPAVKQETKKVAIATGIMTILMWIGFAIGHQINPETIPLNYKVFLGGICGSVVAVLNFFLMGLTAQQVANTEDEGLARSRMRASYSQRFLLQIVWIILAIVAGLVLLFRETGRRPAKGIALLAGVTLAWFIMLLMNMLVFDLLRVHQPYSTQEINIFGMLGIFEVCIRNRLIPSNENHTGFFAQLGLPVMMASSG